MGASWLDTEKEEDNLKQKQMNIEQELNNAFRWRDEKLVFATETGSRLWGIASPDSDYDVRGIYLPSKEEVFDFEKHRDVIDVMDGDFDFSGFHIDKFMNLVCNGNTTVYEWIRSDQIIVNKLPNWDELKKVLVGGMRADRIYWHYISMATGHYRKYLEPEGEYCTYKRLFYTIRGIISAELAQKGAIPELDVEKMFKQTDNPLKYIGMSCLEAKRNSVEKEPIAENKKKTILRTLKKEMKQVQSHQPKKTQVSPYMKSYLKDYVYELKNLYY